MKKTVLAIAVAAALLSGCGSPAKTANTETGGATAATEAEKKEPSYTLRFGHTLTESDIYNVYMQKWADRVFEKTGGDLLIEIYPNAQLGNEEDVIEQIRQGANIGWQTDFARLGTYENGLSVVNAPFFVENLEEAFALTDSKTIQDLNSSLADNYGISNISYDWVQGQRHVFCNKEVKSPDEMKGLMIRTAPAPIWVESVNSLGCTAVSLAYSEIYTGIQTKVVDGCELPYNAAMNNKMDEVCSYVIETGHIFQLNSMIVSKDWLNTLPEDYQKILVDECNTAGKEASEALEAQTAESKQTMVDNGITVVPQSDLDMEAFKINSEKAYEILKLQEVRDAVYKDIKKQ